MKVWAAALAAVFILTLCGPVLAAEEAPAISAQAVFVMEPETGTVILEQNADDRMLIASTTKVMTALVVIESWDDLSQTVTIDEAWTGVEGSSMYLTAGQTLTVEELLYGLLLSSGNDAAVALACLTAGTVEDFAALMNERAASIGCENTHFANPHGLDAVGHYSSARDLALITREAIQNETFLEIFSTASITFDGVTYTNHNRLLTECEGVFGGKTGYTRNAGRALVTCCERDGLTFICVTLNDPDDWDDHTALYDWAYRAYTQGDVLADAVWTVPVVGGTEEEVSVTAAEPLNVLRRTDQEVTVAYSLPTFVYAAVTAGTWAGQATAYVDGQEMGTVELVYAADVDKTAQEELTLWERLKALFGWAEGNVYSLS